MRARGDGGNALDRQAFPSALPLAPATYHCLLDDQPSGLVPARLWSERVPDEPLYFNPLCAGQASLPFTDRFNGEAERLWVEDPATGSCTPFWIGPEYRALLLGNLHPGKPLAVDLPSRVRAVLAAAGILVPADHIERRRAEWHVTVARCRKEFDGGYSAIGELIHPFHIGALRRYYRHLIRKGALVLGDGQSPLRYGAHNEPVCRFFQQQMLRAMSDLAGEPLKPSYTYFISYQSGAELPIHTDRPQCEFSLTLCIDGAPEPECEVMWPIHLHLPDYTVSVFQALGDGLLYRGRTIPHHRDPLADGFTVSSILFHYVRADFIGTLY